MSISSPDDGRLRGDRPLSLPEQQAFDRIHDSLAHADMATCAGWRHSYVTVRLPKLRTVLLAMVLALAVSIVIGATPAWWALGAMLAVIVGLPLTLLYAAAQHQVP